MNFRRYKPRCYNFYMSGRVMYVVRIRISTKDEEEWNKWHNEEHIPQVLAQPGFLECSEVSFIFQQQQGSRIHRLLRTSKPGCLRQVRSK